MSIGLGVPDVESILPEQKAPARLGFWKIAFAVFVGNILTGVVGAIVYEAVTH
jgi:hypothetical protein